MVKKIRDSVVVITGASSGIGRAAALEFSRRGAHVVLGARNEKALQDVATECEALGGKALVVKTDVVDEASVRNLAQRAMEEFKRIDVWINNAGVSLFARTEEAPYESFRRVIETNLMGYVHGARAVLPFFREQGHGVLINNASLNAKIAAPYVSAYVISKYGVLGLSHSLRQELLDAKEISVCTVIPASIDTPFFQHAANYTGRAVKPLEPVYAPEEVAKAMVHLARWPRREVLIGRSAKIFSWLAVLCPRLVEWIMATQVEQKHFQPHAAPRSDGNLFRSGGQPMSVSGGWKRAQTKR